MPRTEILTIGDELVEGRLVDTNAGRLSDRLTMAGLTVARHLSVADDRDEIVDALRECAGRCRAVLVSGGLGPTCDDLTAVCAARAFNRPLERRAEALEHVRSFFADRGRRMSPNNEKQADLPEGCSILPNPCGTAVGFAVDTGSCRLYFMPGVPRELDAMFSDHILPELLGRFAPSEPLVATVKLYGKGESDVAHALEGLGDDLPDSAHLKVQYRATFPEIHVRLVLDALDNAEGPGLLARLADDVRQRLEGYVFATGGRAVTTSYGEVVLGELREAALTLATAESGTCGHLSTLLGPAEDVFLGGVAAPPRGLEAVLPGWSPGTGGAHTDEGVRALAGAVARQLGATVGLAAVGALPTEDEPGRLSVGIVGPGIAHGRHLSYPIDRDRFPSLAAYTALHLLRRAID